MKDVAVKEQKAHIIRAGQERFASEYATRFRSENYRAAVKTLKAKGEDPRVQLERALGR